MAWINTWIHWHVVLVIAIGAAVHISLVRSSKAGLIVLSGIVQVILRQATIHQSLHVHMLRVFLWLLWCLLNLLCVSAHWILFFNARLRQEFVSLALVLYFGICVCRGYYDIRLHVIRLQRIALLIMKMMLLLLLSHLFIVEHVSIAVVILITRNRHQSHQAARCFHDILLTFFLIRLLNTSKARFCVDWSFIWLRSDLNVSRFVID